MKGKFPVEKMKNLATPFYYYDTDLLRATLAELKKESSKYNYHVHYAVKANANEKILAIIRENGFGADCVSGGEINAVLKAGFPAGKIVFAGVGKADWEINLGLDSDIFCFNVESIPELEVIDELAGAKNKKARVALRLNPNVDAHTHHKITTGLNENKFGINLSQLDVVLDRITTLPNIQLVGLHFHIGSQITDMDVFKGLCVRINEIQESLYRRMLIVDTINVGGGLGIDYEHPNRKPIPDFASYFATFKKHLKLRPKQELHFELGRSVVAQCGSLVTKTLYVKEGINKKFVIVDAGMTDLIRPALYDAYHKIENISSEAPMEQYDVVGPICESSDCFGKAMELNGTKRGDLIVLRSAGAYGEIMASRYNCRALPGVHYSEEFL
ncbi:MAG TPA: diaminopimelate decarboxylase [Candidatus Gallibacteroides avistercoris]|uniref:Diaminopimelate decarboxylase n=1 Tax=Candidatus Gallibacteroides avistercoris TaxID=2840833 RepID=A0A9D1M6R4_9BACT|nr:diaminopimelate decarboxylase [Candidatus Gallibacteroides avistercoris]